MDLSIDSCPGLYCGRIWSNGSFGDCSACPRGYRSDSQHLCQLCENDLQLYDWIYLSFMVVIFVLIQLYFIDCSTRSTRINLISLLLYVAIVFETVLAAISSLIAFCRDWNFHLKTCGVKSFSDWYTLFYNPSLNRNFNCTHEAVYPLYSIVFLFYIISIGLVLSRHLYLRFLGYCLVLFSRSDAIKAFYSKNYLTKNIYFALYSIPALLSIHATLAGHYFDYCYFLLVPFPTFFYILTSKFTDPSKL
ncbi:JNK1/MAPK8-associated membrane protein-like protein [Sarcoptes scabiei]|uniref:JNK1/MAPK8-associated membrane protein-like protein n=1 Tax=Sarcoptes scabiei TaxID=52283 RepID=A0A132A603_SARSC|nr:JNK1/MAPK8-associated membrane protein-like protein [Sarcoptes scabiei]